MAAVGLQGSPIKGFWRLQQACGESGAGAAAKGGAGPAQTVGMGLNHEQLIQEAQLLLLPGRNGEDVCPQICVGQGGLSLQAGARAGVGLGSLQG